MRKPKNILVRKILKKNCSGGYSAASRNKWLDNYTWMKTSDHKGEVDTVYMYLFKGSNSVYIGRTIDVAHRDLQRRRKSDKSSVYLFSESTGEPIPPITILEEGLTVERGS